jgi:cytochrome c oxidase subunit 2
VLAPASDQAWAIHGEFSRLILICGFMYILVLIFLAGAIWRAGPRIDDGSAVAAAPPAGEAREHAWNLSLAAWIALVLLGLLILSTGSFLVDASLAHNRPAPLQIKITGYQWWWQIDYRSPDAADPSRGFVTANELHLPVGRPVRIELQSQDVIHSFWVPNLHGKMDLIPGRTNEIRLTPRRIGYFRGQCAEFCGLQHAHMSLQVFVEPPARFAAWRAHQVQPASSTPPGSAQAGAQVFASNACSNCHQVRGTDSGGTSGPDLTHLASRATIAAGTAPFRRGYLAAWISNPQGMKPGANMPAVPLAPDQLNDVVDYLESLQ